MGRVRAHPFRDHFSKWPVVLALHDGRACPRCGGVVIAWQNRRAHEEWHEEQREFNAQLLTAVRQLAAHVGATITEPALAEDEDGEEIDERLARKAQRVARNPGGIVIGGSGGEDVTDE